MKPSRHGPCGLYCGACGATDCDGCRSEPPADDTIAKCKFRSCAREQGLEFCCSCAQYPCQELRAFMNDQWPHHWTIEPNQQYIREQGRQKWLSAQKKQWSCPGCGAATCWYQKACRCGQRLEAWDSPV